MIQIVFWLIDDIFKKAGLKLNASSRIIPYLDFWKKLLINAFFISQFNCYQLIWMCYNRTKNSKKNRFHEKCLFLLEHNKKIYFLDLLEKDSSVLMHHRNLRALITKMYRICNVMTPGIVTKMFALRHQSQYNLRNWSDFNLKNVRTINYGIKSMRCLGPKTWESISGNIKEVNTIESCKSGIQKWNSESCLCRL